MQFTRHGAWPLWLVVAGAGFSALGEPHPLSAEEPKERASFGGHTAVVSSVAVTADGKMLASGSYDTTIKLWDLATGKETFPLRGHTAAVYSVAFAPDSKTLPRGVMTTRRGSGTRPPGGRLPLSNMPTTSSVCSSPRTARR